MSTEYLNHLNCFVLKVSHGLDLTGLCDDWWGQEGVGEQWRPGPRLRWFSVKQLRERSDADPERQTATETFLLLVPSVKPSAGMLTNDRWTP